MDKKLLKDSFVWGFVLWFIGYLLGFVFFVFIPQHLLGWAIMPFGILITLWVLSKKVKGDSMGYYLKVAIAWTLIAVIFDYFFLVKLLKPADGYYKLDIYIYYALTFILPLIVGWSKMRRRGIK